MQVLNLQHAFGDYDFLAPHFCTSMLIFPHILQRFYRNRAVKMASLINGKTVQAIAKELGLTFKRIKHQDYTFDPDIVYLLDKGKPLFISRGEIDALLYWKHRVLALKWNEVTKAEIRKILEDDGTDSECGVCMEDLPLREATLCSKCGHKLCSVCMMKICLTGETIHQIFRGQFCVGHRCPECRQEADYDFRSMYYRVLDRLDEFNNEQQRAILCTKQNDRRAKKQMSLWVEKHPLHYYKSGVIVRLHGLKKQRAWNGKQAEIIGEGVIKNDTFRWPIQLKGTNEKEYMVKQNNMIPDISAIGWLEHEFYQQSFPSPPC